jgi:hypothetical protein
MYARSIADSRLDTNPQPLTKEIERSISQIESKLDTLAAELRSLRRQLESEHFDAQLNRWFWVVMVISAVANLITAAS